MLAVDGRQVCHECNIHWFLFRILAARSVAPPKLEGLPRNEPHKNVKQRNDDQDGGTELQEAVMPGVQQ